MEKRKTPFEIALAAREKKIEPETLRGAARRLFNDSSLSKDDLKQYATPQEIKPREFAGQRHVTAKRS